jgi:phosphate transport system substrate-binding protein
VRFVQSEAGQKVVKEAGFVDLNITPAQFSGSQGALCTLSGQWRGPRDAYCRKIGGRTDLGSNFRFRTGSSQLDNRAVQDLQRVLAMMSRSPGKRLVLIGFADAQGSYPANLALSLERAGTVRSALRALGIEEVEVEGFGSEIPVADNDTDAGREHNRRVEVWMQ